MTTVEATTSPDELLAMPGGDRYELVNGKLLERPVSVLSSWVGGRVFRLLAEYVDAHNRGCVWPADNGLQCFPDAPQKVRRSDACFVAEGRLPKDWTQHGFLRIVPDLVVEVISPGDLAYEVDQKVVEYQDAGVTLIWVINPETRTVRIHRRDGSVGWLKEQDELDGENVVAGFRCPVATLFPKPPEPRPARK